MEDTAYLSLPKIRYGSYTTKGIRDENQDSMLIINESEVLAFVIADGAGGYSYGKQISKITVDAIESEFRDIHSGNVNYIKLLIDKKYQQINSHIFKLEREMDSRMASTVAMLNIVEDNYIVSNVGDTKIFIVRDGEITLISQVHNVAWELYENNEIDYEQYKNHKNKNVLTRALGGGSTVKPYYNIDKLRENDIFIICSDGIHNYIGDKEIKDKFSVDMKISNEDLDKLCFEIAETCLESKSNDNLSIIAVQI
ncbi:hypothetical protein AC231_14185 [Clostridium pasteurianum]|nr:PP2C family serine/threonine-protein phosphatase [Clostridium pasteurianum]AOZ74187.1 hypothetical protein AQ983_03335 [Clostridium pasteurianum DSM 525 = ATCC 6013]AOZ77985.1 hypothetical protein AQ984_03335 [Clostridium pasteurianum]ELP58596.1 Protein serine/threonine phosphatase PrpC, regulation of stationary phase [Clostridium pasteurianum DSM 525 = ATCC 6013]OMH22139.1 hypothetical protein AC231_14185 [Clostridium pasteurianum]